MTDPVRSDGVDGGRGGDEIEGRLDGPVIFVVGAARSGTTWVFDLFNSHPFVHTVFESGLFDPNLGLAGLLAAAPNRWDLSRKRHLVPARGPPGRGRAFTLGLLGNHLKPHHRHLVDKTPGHVYQMLLMAEVFPDARFIHMVRDGRDVAVSQNHARDTWAAGRWKHFPPPFDTAFTARRWARAPCAAARRPRRSSAIGSSRSATTACGPTPKGRSGASSRSAACQTTTRSSPGSSPRPTSLRRVAPADPTGFYRGGRTGDWRRSFTVLDALAFNLLAGSELVEVGYEKGRWWRPDGFRVRRPARGAGPAREDMSDEVI